MNMKAKKLSKKLCLNKKIITHLNAPDMRGAKGGISQTGVCCYTGYETCAMDCFSAPQQCPPSWDCGTNDFSVCVCM